MNRQRWLRTRRRLGAHQEDRVRRVLAARRVEEFSKVAPKPYADYVPDMPWERR